jgi:hypothetical protein
VKKVAADGLITSGTTMKSFNDPVLNEHVESITFSEFSNEDEVKVTIIGFDVLTAVVMKSSIFWDITQCSPLKDNRRFGSAYCLHLHGRRISQSRNEHEADSKRATYLGAMFL